MDGLRTYFGAESLGDSAKTAAVTQGRKRTVSALSLIAFALIAGAADTRDWVKGGVEVFDENGTPNGVKLHWHVDLVTVGIERDIPDIYGDNFNDVVYARADYMKRAEKQSTFPGCTRGKEDMNPNDNTRQGFNFFCGLKAAGVSAKMDATYGLLIFAAILSFVAWILMQALSGGNVAVVAWEHSFKAIGGLMAASCFFSFVAVVNFDAAKVKDLFCAALTPPGTGETWSGQGYCSYSDGFRVGVFAIVFSAIQTVLFFFWMPHTRGTASYAFTEAGEGEGAKAPAPAFSGSGAYQDFGGSGAGGAAAVSAL